MSFVKDQTRLAKLTMDQLLEKRRAIETDPANSNKNPRSIYLYTPAAQRKLDNIAWAITYKLGPIKTHG